MCKRRERSLFAVAIQREIQLCLHIPTCTYTKLILISFLFLFLSASVYVVVSLTLYYIKLSQHFSFEFRWSWRTSYVPSCNRRKSQPSCFICPHCSALIVVAGGKSKSFEVTTKPHYCGTIFSSISYLTYKVH